jgi:DNA repair protein RadC
MKIKEMPWFNRPGARLKKKGPSSLSDAELLAIVLGRGRRVV